MGSKIIKIVLLCLFPICGYAQSGGFIPADTSINYTVGDNRIKFKSWPYVLNAINSKAGGGGTVTNVSRTTGYGITINISNPITTPNILATLDTAGIDDAVSKSRLTAALALYSKLNLANTFTANQIIPRLAIGSGSLTATNLRVDAPITGAATAQGVYVGGQIQSDVTTTAIVFRSIPSSVNSVFTTSSVVGFRAANLSKGASHTVTSQYGIIIDDLTAGTNNYAIASTVSSGTNKWNWYGSGTASNYMAGKLLLGTLTDNGELLQVAGKITAATPPTNPTDVVRKTELDLKADITNVPTFTNYTASGTGAATTITITHGVSGISGTSKVIVQPLNAASAGVQYATISSTQVSIVYTVAPLLGTGNLSYSILIKP